MMGHKQVQGLTLWLEKNRIRLSPKWLCDSYCPKFMIWILTVTSKPYMLQCSGYYGFWVQWPHLSTSFLTVLDISKIPSIFPNFWLHLIMVTEVQEGGQLPCLRNCHVLASYLHVFFPQLNVLRIPKAKFTFSKPGHLLCPIHRPFAEAKYF